MTKYLIYFIMKLGTAHNAAGGFSLKREVITMVSFSLLIQFVIMLTGVITLCYKIFKKK